MYLFLLILLSFIIIGAIISYLVDGKKAIVTGIVVAAIFGAIISAIISSNIPVDVKPVFVSECSLVSIADQNNINGRFFLASGKIHNIMYYTFYYGIEEENEIGYKFGKIYVDDATIFYTDDNPKLQTFKLERIVSEHNKWTLKEPSSEYFYKIYVPKGTIRQNYVLDAI